MLITKRIRVCLLIFTVIALVSCKKESTTFPSVVVTEPFANASFYVGDTILVRATLSDPTLRKVQLTLVDENFAPVLSTLNIPVTGSNMEFTKYLILDNFDLETGKYFVRVKAFNENNSASGFQEIGVTGIPLLRMGWNVACSDGLDSRIYYIPANGPKELAYKWASDFSGMATWSRERRIVFCPSKVGKMSFIENVNYAEVHSEPTQGVGGGATFTGAELTNLGVAIFYKNGFIKIKDSKGVNKMNMVLPTGFFAYYIKQLGEFYFVFAEKPSVGLRVFKFSATSGVRISQYNMGNYRVVYAAENNGYLAVFGNENGTAKTYQLYKDGGFVENYPMPALVMNAAVQMQTDVFALALADGLYKLDLKNALLSPISGVNFLAENLNYDDSNNELIMSKGINLRVYDAQSWLVKRSLNLPLSIRKHELVYNK